MKLGRVSVGDATLDCVDEFSFLGYMNSGGGGSEASSMERVTVHVNGS